MRFTGRIAALVLAAVMGAPAAAGAQTATVPRGGAGISTTPPVPLPDSPPPKAPIRTQSVRDEQPVAASSLPSTGSDPRVLFLCGVALTLLGVGLRLRTADADLY